MMRFLINIALAAILLLSLHVHSSKATRTLSQDFNSKELVLQSLQKAPVPPSGASGCTNIPGTGGPPCPNTINEMNFAGNALSRAATAFPRLMLDFGVATNKK
ncbi:hypothetical protein MANES_03G168300v8 [Manihot esculenta]|uniref:Uncharacterized protein n=1 Tax=Manihot esculenta TaxID=3983 RepID=A0A2C9WAP7_MANES|nr:hypothetical protein MANES_03G168300v8 [Manihot esculenta]